MAVVSPLPQTYALNLSSRPEPLPDDQCYPPSYRGKPVQRVQPNDCHQAGPVSPPVSKPHMLFANDAGIDLDRVQMPDLIVPRKQRTFTPDQSKDVQYWDRRHRNNDAAKRSRQKRRLTDIVLEAHVVKLARENDNLKAELHAIRHREGKTDPEESHPNPAMAPSSTESRDTVSPHYETSPCGLQPSPRTFEPSGLVSVASPISYPVTSVFNPYQRASLKSLAPEVKIIPPMLEVSNGMWPSLSPNSLLPSEEVDRLDRNGVSPQVMPWQLNRFRGQISGKFHTLPSEIDNPHRLKPFFVDDQLGSSLPIVDSALRASPLEAKKASPVSSPPPPTHSVHHGTSNAQVKPLSPPSPHSAFTSGIELSKLPHKLREKMKRSIQRVEETGNCKETTEHPPQKIQRLASFKETNLVAETKDKKQTVTSLSFDNCITPPSSCSSSESAVSPFAGDQPFDFSKKIDRPSSKTISDSTINESYDQMVRAAHALATLNRGTPEGVCFSGVLPSTTQESVPVDDRDKYWDKRRRNNQAAKKCRDAKRLLIDYRAARSAYLEQENDQLRQETSMLQIEVAKLKELVLKRAEAETRGKISY